MLSVPKPQRNNCRESRKAPKFDLTWEFYDLAEHCPNPGFTVSALLVSARKFWRGTQEKQEIFKGLVNIKMKKLPREVEGTCMDYVKLALIYLKEKGIISKIPPKFDELWKSDYNKVQKKVWGR